MAQKQGFTLIELLVVIAIIGLLASIVLASLVSARAKARDSKRMADINEVDKALQLYYSDHGNYPSIAGVTNGTRCIGTTPPNGGWTDLTAALAPYIAHMPNDPGNYTYIYCSDQSSLGSNNSQEYVLQAQLENTTGLSKFTGIFYTHWGGDDLNTCTNASYYCVTTCQNVPGAEGPIDGTHPNGYSYYPPNCGTF